MQIDRLSIDKASLDPSSKTSLCVSLDGIDGSDFVACCEEDLLREILEAAGPELCAAVHEFELEE